MKRIFAFFMTLLLFIGCEKPEQEAMISLDPEQETSVTIPSDGDSFDVCFTSSQDWTAEIVYKSGGEGWADVIPSSGKGSGFAAVLNVNVEKNSESEARTAEVVITSGAKKVSVAFTQKKKSGLLPGPNPDLVFRLVDKSAEVSAEGGTVEVAVEYNVEYKCEITVDWIREIESKSYDQKVHVFEVLPNDSEKPRSTTVSFCGNGTCIPFKVEQAGCKPDPEDPVFALSAQSAKIGAEGGVAEVTVTANVEYEYEIPADWIRDLTVKAAGEYVHTFEVMENGTYDERSAVINFCGNGNCKPFIITQQGCAPEYKLDVDTKTISVEASGTSSPITVIVSSNMAWTVSSGAEWCAVSPVSGENDGSFEVTISESTASEAKMTKITVSSSDGSMTREISVIQYPSNAETDDRWKSEEFIHKSLFMRFTADWCPYCPMMVASLNNALIEFPDKIVPVSVHGDGSMLASPASLALVDYYEVAGFPHGLIDCIRPIANFDIPETTKNIVNAIQDIEYLRETVTGASWTSYMKGDLAVLDLSLYIKKDGSYKVTALLVEDGVVGYQADYQNGSVSDYVHNAVIRSSFTDVIGDAFAISADNTRKDFKFTTTVPDGCNVENMRVIVYVQKQDSGSYCVDNTASAKLGTAITLALKSGNWGDGNEGIVPGDDISL